MLVISHRTHSKHAQAHTDNTSSRRIHVHAHVNDVVQCLLVWRPTIYCIDVRLECNNHSMTVHTPSTVETFGEKISPSTSSGKEIAGLLRKMMLMNMMTHENREISVEQILACLTGGRKERAGLMHG